MQDRRLFRGGFYRALTPYFGAAAGEDMRKDRKFHITTRQLSRILTVAYVLCMIPLLIIAFYDFPSSDDFSMALETHEAWVETGSVPAVLAACVRETVNLYLTWTGYFTSSLITTISPVTFGTDGYWAGVFIVFAGLHAGAAAFVYVLLERVLGLDRAIRRCVTLAVLFMMIQLMPTGGYSGNARVECFYWYSGAANYTLTFALLLLYLSCLLLAAYAPDEKRRRIFLVLSCITGFFTGGGNYQSALTGAILTVVMGALLIAIRKGQMRTWLEREGADLSQHIFLTGSFRRSLFLPMGLMLAGFFMNCLAPGNSVRSIQTSGFGAAKSIFISLYYTLDYLLDEWLNWAVIVIFALLAIIFWRGLSENRSVLTFRHPVVIAILAYGVVSANITPVIFALGELGAGRNKGIFWMQFILVTAFAEYYLLGWLRCRLGRMTAASAEGAQTGEADGSAGTLREGQEICRFSAAQTRTIAVLGGMFLIASAMCVKVDPYYYSFTSAVADLVSGEAKAYAEENAERLVILEDESQQDVVFKYHEAQPELLFYSDVYYLTQGWDNFTMSNYFGKNTILGE